MLAELRVLHVPSSDTNVVPPVILQYGADRYLFNVGEGTSRTSTQRKANLSRVSNIFVSRVGWETIGGLPGVLMSMADGQRPSESLYGPDGLRYALATMRTYAKRDIMKLHINEIAAHTGSSSSTTEQPIGAAAAPIFSDSNLVVYAVPLFPHTTTERAYKKPKLNNVGASGPSSATIEKVDQLWRRPHFNPSNLKGEDAQAWIHLVSDSIFNDSLLRARQQQVASSDGAARESIVSGKLVSAVADIEMEDPEGPQALASPHSRAPSWRPPLSPALVNRLLPPPHTDTRNLSADHSDPAEGGQAPVLAFICESHPQRGKFDFAKATEAGIPPGPSFSALTKGESVTFKRPISWSSMPADERKKWLQSQRAAQREANGAEGSRSKPKPKPTPRQNGKQNGNTVGNGDSVQGSSPAAWRELEEVTVMSSDVMGESRAGAVVFHVYLPSAAYIDNLLSEDVTNTFSPYTTDANRGLGKEQSRTPHAIVHAVPLDVLQDKRYQSWMRRFGPDCNHIVANHDVCANKLMFPSSATIPLRLSKLDGLMFSVPQYQLKPRMPLSELSNGKNDDQDFPLKLVAAEADQVVPLQPRGEPKRYKSGAPDFDWPIQSEEANKLAAFELDVVEETEQQAQQLAKVKAKNSASGHAKAQKLQPSADAPEVDTPDEAGPVRTLRLREARKQAWDDYLAVVKKIKSSGVIQSATVAAEQDILVTTLGTGSAAPSKYRNVISTLIQTPSSGNLLLDAGESTYGLLRRKFGCRRDGTASESGSLLGQDVDDILREMRILFISHIHADHHIGLIRLLLERRKLHPRPTKPLYLVGTGFVHNYLEEYEQMEKLGLDEDVVLILNEHLDHKKGVDPLSFTDEAENSATPGTATHGNSREQRIRRDHLTHVTSVKALTGLSGIHTARVVHRGSHCYGLVLRHATEDWSVAYSGDTRPAPELIAAGRNCKLLIHEATLEDGELEMAIVKGHSTFGEAIRVGHEMGARNILLTHFSQRYPKMARSSLFALNDQDRADENNVPIALAFDLVTYPLSQFSKIQGYTPAMEALFAADTEAEDDEQSVAGMEIDASNLAGVGTKAAAIGKEEGKGQQGHHRSNGSSAKGSAVVAAASISVVAGSNGDAQDETLRNRSERDS